MVAAGVTGLPPADHSAAAAQPAVPLVRFPFPQDDGSLTPYTFQLGYPLITLVYDTLQWRDEAGEPQPWLAASLETTADGRQVSVRLVENARWHDGKPVTAADVAFTFGFFVERPHPRFTPELRAVERVDVLGATSLVITLRQRSPGFTDQPLADLPILPSHLWRDLPRGRSAPDGLAVGSGPYRLVEHRPGQGYRFEANTQYFRGPPAVGALEVEVINTVELTLDALRRRRVDMVPVSLSGAPFADVEDLSTRVARGPGYLGTALVFNVRRPPFDRREVRRAFAGAIDQRGMARAVGDAVAADRGFLHPESGWAPDEALYESDAVRAREILAGLGLRGLEVLAPDSDPVKLEAARQVVVALGRAGVGAEVKALPRAQLSRSLGEDGSPADFDAAIAVIPSLASHDPDFLRRLFGSDRDANLNLSGYRNPAFDRLADAVATSADPDDRRSAVRRAIELLAHDAPAIPLFFGEGAFAYRGAVYDRWVYVKGDGILDKRSFLASPPAPASTKSATSSPKEASEGLSLAYVALALVAVAVVLAGFGVAPRGRRRRR